MGGTLVHAEGIADPWRPAELEAIERDFGASAEATIASLLELPGVLEAWLAR